MADYINDDRNEGCYGDSPNGADHDNDGDGAEPGDGGFSGAGGNASGGVEGCRSETTGKGSADYGGAGGIARHGSERTSWYCWALRC